MIEPEKEMKKKRQLSFVTRPLICLCLFLLFIQIANTFYAAYGVEPSSGFGMLYTLGLLWIGVWWVKHDNKQYKIGLVYDLGLFLYMAWVIVVPYYLFKTRGLKAFITLFSFVGIYLVTYLIGTVVFLVIT
jgi:hypothetical protein